MELLAVLEYIKITHKLDTRGKQYIENVYEMQLYSDRLVINGNHLLIHKVFDISYRKSSEEAGIGYVYLHTDSGVRTFHTRSDPGPFIDTFKRLRRKS